MYTFPAYFYLKQRSDGTYLSATYGATYFYPKFKKVENPGKAETFMAPRDDIHQRVRLQTLTERRFAGRLGAWPIWENGDWIIFYTDASENDLDTWFYPEEVEKNVIMFKNIGNKKYVGGYDTISAGFEEYRKEFATQMEVIPTSYKTTMDNVKFDTNNVRVYNETPILTESQYITNKTDSPLTQVIKFSYSENTSQAWNITHNCATSLKLDSPATFKAEHLPCIQDGKVVQVTSAGTNFATLSGQANSKEFTVTVTPGHVMKVILTGTHGMCDVPYSYDRHDTLSDGQKFMYHLEDGIFTGSNVYNVGCHTVETSITSIESSVLPTDENSPK